MKVREDLRQGHRALLRWIIQTTPIERDTHLRIKLKIFEGKPHDSVAGEAADSFSGDEVAENIAVHELDRKYDIREYFESGTRVDRQQLFVRFPDNEKEDCADMSAAWRRRKKQKLVDELLGTESHEEHTSRSMLITIGKLPENEITCLNPSVSRTHVAIVPLKRSKATVIDLDSKGGTTL